ncbi:YpdA family putative bacillithiol disulfide reductase [Halobacillus shinanisalinarum]|uniref:YpdA family putative bacillithiol disulfide reductase n=1 Tax=Halobacillus shinanisalinarum TaxID=2932258 RepID=A0ABY4H1T3_9BACI|nr:YpdA family putative bacillithiol disulfide reductase [Halobacillus shinanisalinarum]UOQ93602.1 YpdA family putative bacillithiol disulfide reductase [Halobacillus shinanisalinarum]
MQQEKVIIIGAGPCGMSAAIELKKQGIEPLLIEKGSIVNSIYHYPTHQTFFSSSEKLEIGQIPFITERQKPVRNEALAYYRAVAGREQLRIQAFEKVDAVEVQESGYRLTTTSNTGEEHEYITEYVIAATGYYDQPNYMSVKGEELDKVMHYFKEAHPYYDKEVAIIGGKNSAADAALELVKAGAKVTVLYRGEDYSKSIKPWILPQFEALVRKGIVHMDFCANVREVTHHEVVYECKGKEKRIKNDFVFAMTGYRPDHHFLTEMGITMEEETGRPSFNEQTMETNVSGIYIAGVIAAGYNNNEVFIENGRFHGKQIAEDISQK